MTEMKEFGRRPGTSRAQEGAESQRQKKKAEGARDTTITDQCWDFYGNWDILDRNQLWKQFFITRGKKKR